MLSQDAKNAFAILFACIIFNANISCNEWDAKEYSKNDAGQFKYAIKELSKLSLTGSESFLDVGCGDGKISQYIAEKFLPHGHLVGIDKNQPMIETARSNIKSDANVSYECSNILDYKTTNQYDVATSFWTLHWLADKQEYAKALKTISSALKPSGKALLCHIAEYDPLHKYTQQLLDTPKWQEHRSKHKKALNILALEEILESVRLSGLQIEHLELKKNSEWIPLETFKKNILSTPMFNFLPENQKNNFVNDLIQESLQDMPINQDNQILHWLPVVILVLKK